MPPPARAGRPARRLRPPHPNPAPKRSNLLAQTSWSPQRKREENLREVSVSIAALGGVAIVEK